MSPEIYNELLDATISELERMKRHGARFITVEPETLKNLAAKTPAKPDERQQTVRPAAAPDRRTPSSPSALAYGPTSEARAIPSPASARPNPAAASTTVARTPEPDIVISTDAGKIAAFQELRDRALVCQKCPSLVAARKNVVFGVGNLDAELMFVGEAPGADEDEQGEPFVGKAGQLLTKIIQTMGLTREQVYIANILKCRPDTPGQTSGNRPPTPEEMERCLPYLRAQIDLIKPKAMVALGATAVEGLFGKVPGISITKLRGKWKEFRGIPVMPTYHPSYLLRPNVNNVKREAWEDMLQVMERLKIPISEKQRGYFTKSAA